MKRHLLAALLAAGALAAAPAIAQQTSQSAQPTTQSKETVPLQLTKQQVTQLQQKLHQQNLYSGPVDGNWGPETRAAVESFQKKENLPASGKLDTQTMAKLGLDLSSGGGAAIGYGSSQMPQNSGGGAASGYGSTQGSQQGSPEGSQR